VKWQCEQAWLMAPSTVVTRAALARRSRAELRQLVSALPTEILRMIFSTISNKDLGKVMLVCKRWREVGEPLWSWSEDYPNLRVKRADLNMLGINRVQRIDEITVEKDEWEKEELDELFESVQRLPKVLVFNMPGIDLTAVDLEVLTEFVTNNNIEIFDMTNCKLTDHQLNEIFGEIDDRWELCLKISGVNLCNVDKDTLAVGVNRLSSAEMYQTQLTMQQVTSILTQAGRHTKLVQILMDSNTIVGDQLYSGISFFESSTTQLVDPEIVKQAKQNIYDLVLKYDYDFSRNRFKAFQRMLVNVARQDDSKVKKPKDRVSKKGKKQNRRKF